MIFPFDLNFLLCELAKICRPAQTESAFQVLHKAPAVAFLSPGTWWQQSPPVPPPLKTLQKPVSQVQNEASLLHSVSPLHLLSFLLFSKAATISLWLAYPNSLQMWRNGLKHEKGFSQCNFLLFLLHTQIFSLFSYFLHYHRKYSSA